MVRLTAKELRQIALNVVPNLPLDDGDFERVIKFVRELRSWEKQNDPDDGDAGDEEEPAKGNRKASSRLKLYRSYNYRPRV